jgi:cytochrome c553
LARILLLRADEMNIRRSPTSSRLRALAAAVCWLALHACAHDQVLQNAPPAAPSPPPRAAKGRASGVAPKPEMVAGEPFSAFMADHFAITTYARDCVIAGDVESIRGPLMALADYRYDTVAPGGWVRSAAELQATARLTARAESLDAAAAGIATMGRICGDCHTTEGRGPSLGSLAGDLIYDEEPNSLPGRMHRHARGADQLWLGLTAPSHVVWQAGAKTIADTSELAERDLPPSFVGALAEVRELGEQAEGAVATSERADLYGALLATCADCHSRIENHDVE